MYRKPLIILTPKSLLRNKGASSHIDELAKGEFRPLIGETDQSIRKNIVKRVLVCSGKVYYELVNERKERGKSNMAIIRIEELYPFPQELFTQVLKQFPRCTEVMWVQDEPQNQGAWLQIQPSLLSGMKKGQKLSVVSRPASSSPAAGYLNMHIGQQRALLDAAFSPMKGLITVR
jgi:2-oxoglutarate dehydrogenase E1 component